MSVSYLGNEKKFPSGVRDLFTRPRDLKCRCEGSSEVVAVHGTVNLSSTNSSVQVYWMRLRLVTW